jgi:hypothetical protein
MKLSLIIFAAILICACAEKPTLCECMKKSIDINKALNDCKNDEVKIRALNDENEKKMEGCNDLLSGLSASEKEEMSQEAEDCEFYPEFLKLFEVETRNNSKQEVTKF